MSGSMLAGTAEHRLVAVATKLEIITDHDPVDVQSLVEQAERMCFVVNAIVQPHQITTTTVCNGELFPPT